MVDSLLETEGVHHISVMGGILYKNWEMLLKMYMVRIYNKFIYILWNDILLTYSKFEGRMIDIVHFI